MGCVQDESFGPVLTVETFRTEDEAVAIANDTMYGLAGAVWSSDASRGAARGRAACATGRCGSTTTTRTCRRPSGAASSSRASGRELGPTGLHEYLEAKHVYQNLTPAPSGWFAGVPMPEAPA